MMYNLQTLRDRFDREGAEPYYQNEIFLAIAERLEAFVESQRPRMVELDVYDPNVPDDIPTTIAFNDYSFDSAQAADEFPGFVVVLMTNGRSWYVKGTLAEVMAKLRGDK